MSTPATSEELLSEPEIQESDPLTWPEARTLFVELSLRDFLYYIEQRFEDCPRVVQSLLEFFPSSDQLEPNLGLRNIAFHCQLIGQRVSHINGTPIDIFSEAVRWYIRRHVDRPVA